ncbi:epoxyqueuosine reductase [Natroniella acetigena]|nr:epoxyqueuosine reductase [Natroniella acetigena]
MEKEGIIQLIKGIVTDSKTKIKTEYREPIVGFADAKDKRFEQLKEIVALEHKLPTDILPAAETVISFFIPFAREVVKSNRQQANYTVQQWAVAYQETNQLIDQICRELSSFLAEEGIKSAWELPTYNFDQERLISFWSQRSAAKISGLGEFGLNRMLITEQGSAGRYGSIVIDKALTPSSDFKGQPCLYYQDGSCQVCIKNCPIGALTEEGFDRQLCYQRCLENAQLMNDKGLEGLFDVCGKCQVGPCAVVND